MTEYIGDVPVSSIQNVQISRSEERSEIDLVDKSSNIILEGSDEGQEIQIDFTLLKQTHPEKLDVETQRSETKELVSNDVSDNYFEYNGSKYFLSIGDVSVPESSDLQMVREGTITAQALPWPKHFEDVEIGVDKRHSGIIDIKLDVESTPIRGKFVEDEIIYSMAVESFSNILHSSQSVINYSLETDGITNYLLSVDSEIINSFDVESTSNLLYSADSEVEYNYSIIASGNILASLAEDILFDLSTEAEVDSYPIFDSDINYTFGIGGVNSQLFSANGSVVYSFKSKVVPDMKYSSVGILTLVLSSEGLIGSLRSSQTNVSYSLDMNGAVEKEYSGFGRYFGRTFGR